MNINTSRIFLAIQAIILCLPLTILYIFNVIPALLYFLGENAQEPIFVIISVNILIILGIISAWWLIYNFVVRGHNALLSTSIFWWVISGTMATLAALSQLYILLVDSYEANTVLSFGWGVFFLPPFIHILLERRRNKALTNYSSSPANNAGLDAAQKHAAPLNATVRAIKEEKG